MMDLIWLVLKQLALAICLATVIWLSSKDLDLMLLQAPSNDVASMGPQGATAAGATGWATGAGVEVVVVVVVVVTIALDWLVATELPLLPLTFTFMLNPGTFTFMEMFSLLGLAGAGEGAVVLTVS